MYDQNSMASEPKYAEQINNESQTVKKELCIYSMCENRINFAIIGHH